MPSDKFQTVLAVGETVAVEFKRGGGNAVSADTYETVCSFLNRFGGDIYLGVEDDGKVIGLAKNAAPSMIKNFINIISNPEYLHPTVYLAPEIFEYGGKTLIHVHVPPSSEVHSCKKVIYDRVDDADVKVTATGQIAQMYIRKQNIFTERKVYKYVTDTDLRLDLLPKIRQIAMNLQKDHLWKTMSDIELLRSAKLITRDADSGVIGYNLAAVMLLGRDDVIKDITPTYRTDALLRKVNLDRYDDRLIVETNLIESYDLLMGFAEKHLWDKFYLEGDKRISLRSQIAREMLVNTLMHREFTSNFIAKFVIERDRMYTENANRAASDDSITPVNLQPNPKNPIIAAFFRNIGYADDLGSGVRNLYRYVKRYSGKDPELLDGDVFRTVVPLDDEYSFDVDEIKAQIKGQPKGNIRTINCTLTEVAVLEYISANPTATQAVISEAIGRSLRSVKNDIASLKGKGLLVREGAKRNGKWVVKYS
ncbi:MAG: putative DNA binding domain-containing protein [Peptococcaceae bacterium]|nr:putative DNA binding domain-containing protein [Peptococcaceae bacterium]